MKRKNQFVFPFDASLFASDTVCDAYSTRIYEVPTVKRRSFLSFSDAAPFPLVNKLERTSLDATADATRSRAAPATVVFGIFFFGDALSSSCFFRFLPSFFGYNA